MSKLVETKRAYDKIADLLDQEIRRRSGNVKDLEQFREALQVAFYLLGWAQFEYLVRQQVKELLEEKVRAKSVEVHAWHYLQENVKGLSVRKRLDLIFHSDPKTRDSLDKDYELRNEAVHNYKHLPAGARDISKWLEALEQLVDGFP